MTRTMLVMEDADDMLANNYVEKSVAFSLRISAGGTIRRAASLSEAEAIVNEAQAAFRVYLTDDTTPLLEAALFDPLPLAAVRNALPGNVWDLLVSESLAIMEYPEVRLSEPEALPQSFC